jgi:hypothetical protein
VSADNASGTQLVDAMLAAGWQVVGGRTGVYTRLAFVEGRSTSHHIVVPLDESAPEYEHERNAVLWTLRRMADDGRDAQRALDLLEAGEPR